MDPHVVLPQFIQERLFKIGYQCLKVTTPALNAYCAEIKATQTDILETTKNVFIKCPSVDDTSTTSPTTSDFKATLYFANETTFYSQLLASFQQLAQNLQTTTIVPFSSVAQCWYADTSCIILENLFAAGYEPLEIRTSLTYDHARVVLQQLGRFHAFSIALNHHKPQMFQDISNALNATDTTSRILFLEGLQDALKLAKSSFPPNSTYVNKLTYFVFDTYQNYNITDSAPAKVLPINKVITHGDLWPNNILLKRSDNQVESAKFVDFQGCRLASWVNDLMMVILIALDAQTRRQYMEDLLECYRNAIEVKLIELDVEVAVISEVVGKDTFKKELKIEARYAMATALVGLPLYLPDKQFHETERVPLTSGDKVDPVVGYLRELRKRKSMKCKNKMLELIMDCIDYGYLD